MAYRRKTIWAGVGFTVLGLLGNAALADHVVMRDGSEQVGKILSVDDKVIRIRMQTDGITGVVNIPRSQVDWIERDDVVTMESSAHFQNVTRSPTTAPATRPGPATRPNPAVTTAPALPAPDGHLLRGMLRLLAGRSPDLSDPETLPPGQHGSWEDVVGAESSAKKEQLLSALITLANAGVRPASRLDALAWRHVGKSYGMWLAETRWDCIAGRYRSGQFDLRDVTEVEKQVLIGILRGKTQAALDPLRAYFPPPPAPVAPGSRPVPAPRTADLLASITVQNALEVQDHALYASAMLLAQLRLEPEMPAVDRTFLSQQLGYVRAVLGRTSELEPAAKALKAREEQDRKLAEERARRDAARAAPPANRPGP